MSAIKNEFFLAYANPYLKVMNKPSSDLKLIMTKFSSNTYENFLLIGYLKCNNCSCNGILQIVSKFALIDLEIRILFLSLIHSIAMDEKKEFQQYSC